MKKAIFIFLGLTSFLLSAQKFQGKVTYNHKTKLEIDEEISDLQNKVIEGITERNVKVELIFNKSESLYRARPIEMPDMSNYGSLSSAEQEKLGNRYKRAFGAQEHDFIYRNFDEGKIALTKTIRGKQFLISQVTETGQWKMTNEEKIIVGYTCKKAIKYDGDKKIIAWYASEILVASGPSMYSKLPGLILEVNSNNGEIIITAENVELSSKYNKEIVAPTKGKKVTLQKFNEIKSAKDKELEMLRQEDMRAEKATNRN